MAAIAQLVPNLGTAASEVADALRPSVVEVTARQHGNGAGTIWRADGIVVTNYHVVPGDGATVRLHDGRSFDARTIAQDPANDLAVLKIAAFDLPAPPIGDARALRTGEIVLAIGHPYGNRGTLTVGIVAASPSDRFDEAAVRGERDPDAGVDGRGSAPRGPAPDGRSSASGDRRPGGGGASPGDGPAHGGRRGGPAAYGRELIRAAVLLGPGNSGGPLADSRGRVVGINAMVAGGLALAVPSHLVERLLTPESVQPKLGIEAKAVELPPGLAVAAGAARGLLVVAVRADTTADRAGLMIGDILVRAGDEPSASADELAATLAAHGGGPLRLSLLRGGTPRELWASPEAIAQKAA